MKSRIYLHGGGSTIGDTLRVSIPSYRFFSIELNEFAYPELKGCFPGSYGYEKCSLCGEGTYSKKFSQESCDKCSVGTYNNVKGSNDDIECYPCPSETYSNAEGATYCLECPTGSYCPVGSTSFSNLPLVEENGFDQPETYSPSDDINDKKMMIYYT